MVDHLGRKPLSNERGGGRGAGARIAHHDRSAAVAPMRQQKRFAMHTKHQSIAVLAVSSDGVLLASVAWLDGAEVDATSERGVTGAWELAIFESESGDVRFRRTLPSPDEVMRVGPHGQGLSMGDDEASSRYVSDGRVMIAWCPTSHKLAVAMAGGILLWNSGSAHDESSHVAHVARSMSHDQRRVESGMSRHVAHRRTRKKRKDAVISARAEEEAKRGTLTAYTWSAAHHTQGSLLNALDSEFDQVAGCCWATPNSVLTVRARDQQVLLWQWSGSLHNSASLKYGGCSPIALPPRSATTRVTALASSVRMRQRERTSGSIAPMLIVVGLSDGRVWVIAQPSGEVLGRWAPPGTPSVSALPSPMNAQLSPQALERRRV